ncbi:MAG: tRNA pseudouridine(55) synthase TruB [Gammaproteobacteria bacterium]|nr:tRNA pseudouridine(55) synthase TruB [Gammaproteobacteria bacterium]
MRQPNRIPRREISGIFLLDKPPGISSNGALQRVRYVFGAAKGGHTGNLDVAASGLLPICLGEATKVSAWLLESDKGYIAELALGVTTNTGDAEGQVIATGAVTAQMLARVPEVLTQFLGPQEQVPPMYSALKRGGRPLYELARAGIEVARAARPITIKALRLLALDAQTLRFEVLCTKGTYIRVLAEEIGAALGCGGSLSALRRTLAGPFQLNAATALSEFAHVEHPTQAYDDRLAPIDSALSGMPALALDTPMAQRLWRGQMIEIPPTASPGLVRAYGPDGGFIGICEVLLNGRLVSRRLMSPQKSSISPKTH